MLVITGQTSSLVLSQHHHQQMGRHLLQSGSRPGDISFLLPSLLSGGAASAASAPSSTSTALAAAAASTTFDATNSLDVISMLMPNLPPRARSAVYMALSMAFHFGGYEFVRSANLALFTSETSGFKHPAAFPLAMGLVSPFTLILLAVYGRQLEHHGPHIALRNTSFWSMMVIGIAAVLLKLLEGQPMTLLSTNITLSQILVGFIFIFQNSYAHLLYTQQWSFLGSILSPAEGSTWFSTVTGVCSFTCSLAGTLVHSIVDRAGLCGLMACTSATLLFSLIFSEQSYATAEKFDFDPAEEMKKKKEKKKEEAKTVPSHQHRLIPTAIELFGRVPTLGALFLESISYQSLSTVVNTCMVTQLKSTIRNDMERAAWIGRFFALINGTSGALQFLILPLFMKRLEPRVVLRLLPLIPVACAFFQSFRTNPSLALFAFSFFCIKTLDYSFRGVVNEIVYQPLDFESRYLGKEIIQVFGSRVGKSGMSLFLSALTYLIGANSFGTLHLSRLATFVSLTWLGATWSLSKLVLTKEQAEQIVAERQHRAKSEKKVEDDHEKQS